jgi:hypothetical protein
MSHTLSSQKWRLCYRAQNLALALAAQRSGSARAASSGPLLARPYCPRHEN